VANSPKEAQARAEASARRKEQQVRDGKLAMAEYQAARQATREKTARLRKLREAKEAADRRAAARKTAQQEPRARKK
jgi:hypothetical protein